MKLEIGSARKTPVTPKPNIRGRIRVRGMTINAFRSREKNTACLERPNATAEDWPAICPAIMKKPKK